MSRSVDTPTVNISDLEIPHGRGGFADQGWLAVRCTITPTFESAPRHEVAPGWFVVPRLYRATSGPDRAARTTPRLLYQSSAGATPAGAYFVLVFNRSERFGLFPKCGTLYLSKGLLGAGKGSEDFIGSRSCH